ncbi:hypothetical protein BJ875DRAFT_115520 [Amylocarpus encephaloides]|uniref:Uncharacterized protein n=1 Tax=Amylocarpus encephaloides TaxID=45428 RepID=A0A9P8C2W5_9HELO|nr:hypothetical protein BJ875DRAFT_115520 [Amylocarpus encephaloides]
MAESDLPWACVAFSPGRSSKRSSGLHVRYAQVVLAIKGSQGQDQRTIRFANAKSGHFPWYDLPLGSISLWLKGYLCCHINIYEIGLSSNQQLPAPDNPTDLWADYLQLSTADKPTYMIAKEIFDILSDHQDRRLKSWRGPRFLKARHLGNGLDGEGEGKGEASSSTPKPDGCHSAPEGSCEYGPPPAGDPSCPNSEGINGSSAKSKVAPYEYKEQFWKNVPNGPTRKMPENPRVLALRSPKPLQLIAPAVSGHDVTAVQGVNAPMPIAKMASVSMGEFQQVAGGFYPDGSQQASASQGAGPSQGPNAQMAGIDQDSGALQGPRSAAALHAQMADNHQIFDAFSLSATRLSRALFGMEGHPDYEAIKALAAQGLGAMENRQYFGSYRAHKDEAEQIHGAFQWFSGRLSQGLYAEMAEMPGDFPCKGPNAGLSLLQRVHMEQVVRYRNLDMSTFHFRPWT